MIVIEVPHSSNPFLVTLCATPEGVKRVQDETRFNVVAGLLLERPEHQHYEVDSRYFTEREKHLLRTVNTRLKTDSASEYDKGLLLAFYYGIPNNSMPIIWKEGWVYQDEKGAKRSWFALLPRSY
jgi:hypothetical protein